MNVKTKEHGRFYIGSHGNRRFAGSASGVYLADTIRHNLGDGGIMEAFISQMEGDTGSKLDYRPYILDWEEFDVAAMQKRMDDYFTVWHPLFPFLDGAYIRNAFNTAKEPEEGLILSVIFRAIFTIAGQGGRVPMFADSTYATTLANIILNACESSVIDVVPTVQALFAIELMLYKKRQFRPASHISGTIATGLHRCPCRYPTTFDSTSQSLRKRLFYSIYTLDRFLCKQLGHPISFRDIDVDVCLPGADEIHGTLERDGSAKRPRVEETPVHPSNPATGEAGTPGTSYRDIPARVPGVNKLLPAFSLAKLARIMGQITETFNGSRRWRMADNETALRIRTELEEWWLDFEMDMQDASDPRGRYTVLFRCLYNQQLIHLNRHSLSLPPENRAHRMALQAVILASRTICSILENAEGIIWPGYPDLLFDATLFIMYGTKLPTKLSNERVGASLRQAETALQRLNGTWESIRPILSVNQTFSRRFNPVSLTTDQSTNLDLDWLIGTDFNLEANPSGPDLYQAMGTFSDDTNNFNMYLNSFWPTS